MYLNIILKLPYNTSLLLESVTYIFKLINKLNRSRLQIILIIYHYIMSKCIRQNILLFKLLLVSRGRSLDV
jgi:hypothetical protein